MEGAQPENIDANRAMLRVESLPVFYFYLAADDDFDPRSLPENDPRLKPIGIDPNKPLWQSLGVLKQEYLVLMDFQDSYVCRLHAPKGSVIERSWLTLRRSLAEQNVTEYDYVVIYPVSLLLQKRQRSFKGEVSGYMTKRSIKGERKTGYRKRFCILTHQFIFYFEKQDMQSFPLGVFALDFYQVERLSVQKKRKKEKFYLQFKPIIQFGKPDNAIYELSSEKESEVTMWNTAIEAVMYGWTPQ